MVYFVDDLPQKIHKIFMEIWSSMKIMKKDHRGHKLMVQ